MNRSTMYRRISAAAVVTLFASAWTACSSPSGNGNEPDPVDPATTAQETVSVEPAPAADDVKAHRPMLLLVRESLAELDLRADQVEAVKAIGADVDANVKTLRDARRELAWTVADGVDAGLLDEAEVDAKSAALLAAANAKKPAMQDALNRLHATLDASQRRALVDNVRAKVEAAHAKEGDHHGRHRGGFHGKLAQVADQLRLTPQQRDTIRDVIRTELGLRGGGFEPGKPHGREARLQELGNAFVSDQFDAKTLDIGREAPEAAQKVAAGLVRASRLALPVLTPDQRIELADMIRRKEAAHHESAAR